MFTSNDGLEVRYGYDALNRIRHIHYGNGVETAYTYDGDGNIRTLETRAGENVLISFAYRYDGNGNRTAKTGMQAGVTLGGVTSEITTGNNALDISYAYDVRGQLLEERRNGTSVCYAYDKAGNRIRKTDAQGEIRYLYNAKNQLVEEESPADRKQFSYDRQGGIIEEKNAAGIRRSPITAAASRQGWKPKPAACRRTAMMRKACVLNCWKTAGEPALYTTMESFCRRREEKSRAPVIISGQEWKRSAEDRNCPTTTGMNSSARPFYYRRTWRCSEQLPV